MVKNQEMLKNHMKKAEGERACRVMSVVTGIPSLTKPKTTEATKYIFPL